MNCKHSSSDGKVFWQLGTKVNHKVSVSIAAYSSAPGKVSPVPLWQLCYCMRGFPQKSVRALLMQATCVQSLSYSSLFSLIIKFEVFLWLFPYTLSFGWPLALYYLNCFYLHYSLFHFHVCSTAPPYVFHIFIPPT